MRNQKGDKEDINDDIIFEVELMKQIETKPSSAVEKTAEIAFRQKIKPTTAHCSRHFSQAFICG